jgi:hypothetical protein
MITQDSVLVQLIRLVECIPSPKQPPRRLRGRPYLYSQKLFMKALVIMIVRGSIGWESSWLFSRNPPPR